MKYLKKITALCASAVLGVCGVVGSYSTAWAADSETAAAAKIQRAGRLCLCRRDTLHV